MFRSFVSALAILFALLPVDAANANNRIESDVPGGDAAIAIHMIRKIPATQPSASISLRVFVCAIGDPSKDFENG